jgi:serine/threonine protein kinase
MLFVIVFLALLSSFFFCWSSCCCWSFPAISSFFSFSPAFSSVFFFFFDRNGRLLKTACGSPCYAAPEMIAGKKYYGPLADIWSLGVILFALLCGYLPFEDPNTAVLYDKILHGDYQLPSFVSSGPSDLVKKLLTTDPSKRSTARQVRCHPWYCSTTSTTDPPPEDLTALPVCVCAVFFFLSLFQCAVRLCSSSVAVAGYHLSSASSSSLP